MKHLVKISFLFLTLSFTNSFANDSLLVYCLPHQIKIEQNWGYVVSKTHSIESELILVENLKQIIPANVKYKIIVDSSYSSSVFLEGVALLNSFDSGYKVYRNKLSDSTLAKLNPNNNYTKILFIVGNGFSSEYKKDLATIILDLKFGGALALLEKKKQLVIQSLVFDNRLKNFVYYENAGDYGEPLTQYLSLKILELNLNDYFKRGANLKVK